MSRERRKNKTTKTIAVIVACLMLAAVGGTIAWMTAQDSLTNEFLVGDFTDPDTDPTNPDNPLPNDPTKVNGHLYEPSWVANSKLLPGSTIPKDPMVGIGDDSEDAYVYLYIKNNAANPDNIYFELNNEWEPVENYARVANVAEGDPEYDVGKTFYKSGLFRYKGVLDGKEGENSWTTKAFNNVYVKASADTEGLVAAESKGTTLEVTALLHQVTSGDGTDLKDEALQWAKEQATELAQ